MYHNCIYLVLLFTLDQQVFHIDNYVALLLNRICIDIKQPVIRDGIPFLLKNQIFFSIVDHEETMSLIQYPNNATVKSPMIWTSATAEFKSVGGDKKNHKFSVLQTIQETNSLLAVKSFVFPQSSDNPPTQK